MLSIYKPQYSKVLTELMPVLLNNDLQEQDQRRREIMQYTAIVPPLATIRMQPFLNSFLTNFRIQDDDKVQV